MHLAIISYYLDMRLIYMQCPSKKYMHSVIFFYTLNQIVTNRYLKTYFMKEFKKAAS